MDKKNFEENIKIEIREEENIELYEELGSSEYYEEYMEENEILDELGIDLDEFEFEDKEFEDEFWRLKK